MKEKIMLSVIMKLMDVVLQTLDGDTLKKFVDYLLDKIEAYAMDSTTKLDNLTVMPLCSLVRKVFSIPEFD